MKRIILVLIIAVSLLIPGCSEVPQTPEASSTSHIPSLPDLSSGDYKDPVEITVYHKKFQNLSDETWLEYISDNFNIQLKPIEQLLNDGITILTNEEEPLKLNGLFRLYQYELEQIYDEIHLYAMPLNEILNSNMVWNELPLDLKEAMKIDETIWTFPTHYKPYGDQRFLRLYNSEILSELNLEVPGTNIEFENVMRNVQESGFVEYTIPVTEDNPFHPLIDLFWSFNIPISASDYYISSIQYDYVEEKFKDYAATQNMHELISLIEHLGRTGILKARPEHMDEQLLFKMGKAFSIQSMIYDRAELTDVDYRYTFLLNESEVDIKIPVSKIGGQYILLKDTKDPEQIINRLIDTMLSSEEANIGAYLGYDESKYQIKTDSVIYNGHLYRNAPAFFRNIVSDKAFISEYTLKDDKVVKIKTEEIEAFEDNYISYINLIDPARITSIIPYIDSKRTDNMEINMLFNEVFKKVLDGEVSVEALFDEYEVEMQKKGGYAYIEELNNMVKP